MTRSLIALLILSLAFICSCAEKRIDTPHTSPTDRSESHRQDLIDKVLEFYRLFNLPGESHSSGTSDIATPKDQLFNFIQREFSIHTEIFSSVWGEERFLFGLDEIRRLFSIWKRHFSAKFYEAMQVNNVVQSGNVVAVYFTLVIQGEKSKRVDMDCSALFYFDTFDHIHRVFFAWDHHQILLQLGITKVKNPYVEHIFSDDDVPDAASMDIDRSDADSQRHRHVETLSESILQYMDIRNNRDTEDIKEYHSHLFSKNTPIIFQASAFGPGRYLHDYNKVKEYLTGEDFVNLPGSIHAVNDIFESGNHVIIRYTRVLAVKSDRQDKFDNDHQRNCPLKQAGYKCMHIEGINWSTFHPETRQLTRVFTAQDNFRILREQGILKDVMDETSWIYDYLYAKKMVDEKASGESRMWSTRPVHDEM